MTVLLENIDGGVARLTLNRPEAGNALNLELVTMLAEAVGRHAADPSVRCVTITGAGPRFCVGGDIGAFAAGEPADVLRELASEFHVAIRTMMAMDKPLVMLVNGPAAGAGLSLCLYGDIVVATRSAHFTAAYTGIGLSPDGGLTWTRQRMVGLRLAQDLVLTNRRLSADEALASGLVSRLVDDDELADAGASIAATLAAGPVAAFGASRHLLQAGSTTTLSDQLDREAEAISRAGAGPECREGLSAFLTKRKPDFTRS
jgi:2-(1,2-epoxy-1,2-dihydrophenyl)acetyl-CoA isomerase